MTQMTLSRSRIQDCVLVLFYSGQRGTIQYSHNYSLRTKAIALSKAPSSSKALHLCKYQQSHQLMLVVSEISYINEYFSFSIAISEEASLAESL